jgi:hypothetical protein
MPGDFHLPVLLPHCPGRQLGGEPAVDVEAHHGSLQVGRVQLPRSVQSAFLADGEEEGDGRIGQAVIQQGFRQGDEDRTAGPVVSSEGGRAVGHHPVALALWHGADTERHGVEVRGEGDSRPGASSGKFHDQVAGLCGEGDPLVHRIKTNRRGGHTNLLQLVRDGGGDCRLLARDALDGEQSHQQFHGGFRVDRRHVRAHASFLVLWESHVPRLPNPAESL